MNLLPPRERTTDIVVVESDLHHCSNEPVLPEDNVNHCNYSSYIPTGDIDTEKGKTILPQRTRILELLRPEDPGREELEAIVRPVPRRGLTKPYDEDTWRFLQRALQTPSPHSISTPVTPESQTYTKSSLSPKTERSLADELREAEEEESNGSHMRRELLREFQKRGGGIREALERDRLAKLALSVEDDEEEYDDESGLTAAARRLDALLAESRNLHEELAEIHEDIQVLSRRVSRRDP
ncbi:unnamed protein product [Leptidea sinapis]|uniref:Uncharacterized protein n=1 Tax=Leptidea sinapis TaxID=189913 RepID=A0A5E4R5Q2_9NEOP|nr:unnamed protein product [Leptidea sinapis]